MNTISIGGRKIGPDAAPFIIAEISGNHNGSPDRAKKLIRAAADCGVDCVKFQTYTADTITMDADTDDFKITDPGSLWYNRTLHSLYTEAHTPWEWHKELFDLATDLGLIAFSSPFDYTAVDFLETLNVPMYKVASFEITHLPLIRKIARTGKPMIFSTGIAAVEDIELALQTAREAGAKEIILLKCTSAYPAKAKDANLMSIPEMRERFGTQIGLSDHTLGIGVPVASVALGATVIEKHFTLARSDGGVDSAFSLEPTEMAALKTETERAWLSLGSPSYSGQSKSRYFSQTIFPSQGIKSGEAFTAENLKICRPGTSLAPKHYADLLGKTAKRDLNKGERLNESDLS